MNATIEKFGYPANLLVEHEHWVVLLRPRQVTLGSLVLACKESATGFPLVSAAAWADLPRVTGELEQTLARNFENEKINYLALMMVDKEVHFHVLPRYSGPREFAGVSFTDDAWPGPPDITSSTEMSDKQFAGLRELLLENWS
jgi:diadenosine tetraphosphate (Ap4A) HIT family hydrolase